MESNQDICNIVDLICVILAKSLTDLQGSAVDIGLNRGLIPD